MVRGRRTDRSRPPLPTASGSPFRHPGSNASRDGDGPEPAAHEDALAAYEAVEFEEIDEAGRTVAPSAPAEAIRTADQEADRIEDHVMSQPTEPRGPIATDPDPPAPVERPQRRGGSGFIAGILGGLLGSAAVLGGGGWYAYEHGPVKPALTRLETTEASARNAETGLSGLGQQVAQVQSGVDELRASLEGTASRVEQMEGRVSAAEQTVTDLRGSLEQASSSFRAAGEEVISRLEAVNARMVELGRNQPADVVDKGTVEGIAGKQAGIEQAQQRLEAGLGRLEQLVAQGLEAGNQQGAAMRSIVDAGQARLETIATELQALAALREQLAQQQSTDAELRAAVDAATQQIATLRSDIDQRVTEVTARLTELDRARERGIGMSLAVDSLETALQTGQPFAPTLEVLNQLGQDDPVVQQVTATLQPMAAEGVPTLAELAQQLTTIQPTSASEQPTEPSDWLERTRQNLQGLVDLNAAGEQTAGTRAVQDATQALLLQDLESAAQAMEPLAQQGNEEAAAWVAGARSRLEARGAVESLRQHVKSLLARQD